MIRSFQKLIRVDPGFRTDHLLSLEITLPQPRYQDETPATNHFYERLIDKLKQSPGIVSAGTTIVLPFKASHVMTRFSSPVNLPLLREPYRWNRFALLVRNSSKRWASN